MAKILCVLYPDPSTGYPPIYPRDEIPVITRYANGQTAPTPKGPLGFKPGELVGCVSGELGLRPYLEKNGHELIVTSDKDSPNSEFEKHLPDVEVVISQPFWPAYLTAERIAKAKKLKLALTAGIGSDHVDLAAAARAHVTVAEVTGSNSISVAEHVVMTILALVRNYLPSHNLAANGVWNIADCVSRSYDIEGMHFGAIAAGRIGLAVLHRLQTVRQIWNCAVANDVARVVEKSTVNARVQTGIDFFWIERTMDNRFNGFGDDVLFAVAVRRGGFAVRHRQIRLA